MAVNGIPFTLPVEPALTADIVAATGDVRFRQLAIGRGIVPPGGATFRAPAQLGWATRCASCSPPRCPALPRPCGSGRRRRWCLLGADVTRATELARPIARQTLPGVRAISASTRAGLGHGPDAGYECTALLLPGILRSQDAVEGLRSFIGRREGGF